MKKLKDLSKQELIDEVKRLRKILDDMRQDDKKLSSQIEKLIEEEIEHGKTL